jgi:hypothetical protein
LTVQDDKVFGMMEEVGKGQQQRYVTFPVTVASSPREVDPDTLTLLQKCGKEPRR